MLYFTEHFGSWELCLLLYKESINITLGMTSLMRLTLPYEEGEFSGNLLYYRKLIGEWEIALPTVKKCSFATHDILGFALV